MKSVGGLATLWSAVELMGDLYCVRVLCVRIVVVTVEMYFYPRKESPS